MACVTTAKFSVSINGKLHGYFGSSRGIRQGDPLSPYLFILVMEIFSGILKAKTDMPDFHWFWRCKKTRLSHLFFADDVLLFAEGHLRSVQLINESLLLFSDWSGLKPNKAKSNIFITGGTQALHDQLIQCLGFQQGPDLGVGGAKVVWKAVCLPKEEGGLGIRRLVEYNNAMTLKHIWLLFTDKESLWCKWIHSTFLKKANFWLVPKPTFCSWTWKKILDMRLSAQAMFRWKIGNGHSVSFWFDWWHSRGPLYLLFSNAEIYQSRIPRDATVRSFYEGSWQPSNTLATIMGWMDPLPSIVDSLCETYTQVSKRFFKRASHATSDSPAVSGHLKNEKPDETREVLDIFQYLDVHSFTKMIMGCQRTGCLDDALKLFYEIPVRDAICRNTMIKGCLDCGDLMMAEELFDEMPEPSVVSWTTMIDGFFRFGQVEQVERFFKQMLIRDLAAWNAMLHGYCENARVDDAVKLFEQMPSRNVIPWTPRTSGRDQNGKSEEALILFERMFESGVVPNSSNLTCALSACANASSFPLGVQIHGHVFKSGFCLSRFVCASVITFYANCKRIEKATQVFNEAVYRNVVICTALLTGYGSNGRHEDGLEVFSDMMRTSVLPNQSSSLSSLNSCCSFRVSRSR
ncbi:pentatricopeptide repeat-containing protein At1g25360-like [Syzygium oleosum]|uniref:pentatricopeptide repeat-containing protein At1g25360-like n=1 Tax=Syzygium oleosum TaxID=219896 RepID=UPI0024BB02E8|nr:pentatricopeptide repeat-containing protein At1g25360-like [Syzygium oleosum]